jgi:hypothetical protein
MEVNLMLGNQLLKGRIDLKEVTFDYQDKPKDKQMPLIADPDNPTGDWRLEPATEGQKAFLDRYNIEYIPGIKKGVANSMIHAYRESHKYQFPDKLKEPPVVIRPISEEIKPKPIASKGFPDDSPKTDIELTESADHALTPWEAEEAEAEFKKEQHKVVYSHGGKRPVAGRPKKYVPQNGQKIISQ